jgi:hypothetical protein
MMKKVVRISVTDELKTPENAPKSFNNSLKGLRLGSM